MIKEVEYYNYDEVFFIDEITIDDRCKELEEIFKGLRRMSRIDEWISNI